RTHPRLATLNGDHQPNDRYRDPQIFLRSRPPPPSDPLEQQHPAVELVNPSPAAGRQAVRDLGGATELPDADVADLLVATSEVITNALVHGQPPVIIKGWAAANRIVITVIDHGQGPQDPYVGLV